MKAEITNRHAISANLRSLRQNRVYLLIFILLLVSALIWVLITIMEAGDESVVTAEAQKYATPINPNLDVAVFATVESKRSFSEAELETFSINRLVKDRSGNYIVIPLDTPKDTIEELTSGTQVRIAPSTPTPLTSSTTATGAGTINQ